MSENSHNKKTVFRLFGDRYNSRRAFSTVMLCFLIQSLNAFAVAWPDLSFPEPAQISWVGENMNQNGRPTRIAELTTALSADELVLFYEKQWSAEPSGYKTTTVAGNPVVSTLDDGLLQTVQINHQGGQTQAWVSQARVDGIYDHPADKLELLLPNSTNIVSDTKSDDHGKLARTVLALSNLSVAQIRHHYELQAKAQGWRVLNQHKEDQSIRASSVIYRKRKSELVVALTNGGEGVTEIVVTHVVDDTLL